MCNRRKKYHCNISIFGINAVCLLQPNNFNRLLHKNNHNCSTFVDAANKKIGELNCISGKCWELGTVLRNYCKTDLFFFKNLHNRILCRHAIHSATLPELLWHFGKNSWYLPHAALPPTHQLLASVCASFGVLNLW